MRSVPADEGSVSVVLLHVYDVTKTASDNTNMAIKRFNSVTRDVMGVGGVFHGGVEVNGAEWSYGFCDEGTGVYCCEPKKNPMYTYR
jgi:deubiquitinase DESI2